MSKILAIDTTSDFGSIALLAGGILLEDVALHSPQGFSSLLYPQLDLLLARHRLRVNDIDAFAAAAGPGSFTGVRVGLTAIKGLAAATGRAAIGVSNLQALASYGSAKLRAAVLDARRGEVYASLYNAQLQPLGREVVTTLQNWLHSLPSTPAEFICPDASSLRAGLPAGSSVIEQRFIASAVAQIATDLLDRGELVSAALLDANYIRRSDAELLWREA